MAGRDIRVIIGQVAVDVSSTVWYHPMGQLHKRKHRGNQGAWEGSIKDIESDTLEIKGYGLQEMDIMSYGQHNQTYEDYKSLWIQQ